MAAMILLEFFEPSLVEINHVTAYMLRSSMNVSTSSKPYRALLLQPINQIHGIVALAKRPPSARTCPLHGACRHLWLSFR